MLVSTHVHLHVYVHVHVPCVCLCVCHSCVYLHSYAMLALATDVGVILATMDCTLNDIRRQINELLAHTTTNGADEQGWTFLNGRTDCCKPAPS